MRTRVSECLSQDLRSQQATRRYCPTYHDALSLMKYGMEQRHGVIVHG